MMWRETQEGLLSRELEGWSLKKETDKRIRCKREVALKGHNSHIFQGLLCYLQALCYKDLKSMHRLKRNSHTANKGLKQDLNVSLTGSISEHSNRPRG